MLAGRPDHLLPGGFNARQILAAWNRGVQELILFPTEKCNFRCTYCYEDFALGRMPESIQRGVENLISKRAGALRQLRFSWFGGEPLLALDVILRLSGFAMKAAKSHDFSFEGGLITNGYLLTPQVVRPLLDHKQNFFQVTLDGWRDVHDTTRRRADGDGTFETIWNNLRSLKGLRDKFCCLLRIHLRPDNIESIAELCGHLRETLLRKDERFVVDFHRISDMGGEGGKTVQTWDMDQYYRVERKLRAIVDGVQEEQITIVKKAGESQGSRPGDSLSGDPYICYAAKPNSLVIRSDGRIGKCTVALSDHRNDVGQLNEDGTIDINQPIFNQWIRGFETLDAEALACPAMSVLQSATSRSSGAAWKMRRHT